jgi:heme-degrading monooxygenase HmoA
MAVLIRHRNAGMNAAQYDQIAPPLVAQLTKQPGFLLHVTYEDAAGFVVAELWETQEQHDTWFDANVKPNVPGEISQEVIALHSVHKPS